MNLRTALLGVFVVACRMDDVEPPDDGSLGGSTPITSSSTGALPHCRFLQSGCGFGQFCDTQAGECDGEGVCTNAPPVCQGECPGVCGCDGVHYCNACVAWQAGVDVDADASCARPPPSYEAFNIGGEPTRVVLFKSDVVRDVCIRVVVIAQESGLELDVDLPAPWSVESVLATDHALDCRIGPSGGPLPPQGASVEPIGVTGAIDIDGPSVPCGVSASLALELPATDWLGPSESFELPQVTFVLCD